MKSEDVPEGPLLVDTDVFSWVTRRRQRYQEFNALIRGHMLAVLFATVATLRSGALIANWGQNRIHELEQRIAQHYVVLAATDAVTAQWAQINARLRDQLKGGGINDIWIAACSLAQPTPPPVVTGNLSDFNRIAAAFPLKVIHPDLPS